MAQRQVILLDKKGVERPVSSPRAFVQAVYGSDWRPKTGSINSNYLYLTGGTDDPVQDGPLDLITRAELADTIAELGLTAVPASSATVAGRVELATTAETKAGTDAVRAVTPAGLKASVGELAAAAPEVRAALVPRPSGGTDGQVLTKSGDDITWATPSGGGSGYDGGMVA